MDLREYEQAKFGLAEILRSAAPLAGADRDGGQKDRFQDLFARLAEDRFNLVFIGRFNRGKSSLMNAMLGTGRLPTGIVPLTSVITTVRYGTHEKVTLAYRGRHLDIEIAMEDLARYVTQQGNPANALGIAAANVELPAQILRRGFYFVDTPGLSSAIAENTLTTETFLPEADALVLVTSYESPLSEEEIRLCRAAADTGLRVFVVINKQDIVSDDERREVGDFVRGQLLARFGDAVPQVFSVSARDGLAAKLAHDPFLLASSGMPEFEAHLTNFLLEHKQSRFLARMCGRIRDLLELHAHSQGIADLLGRVDTLVRRFDRRSDSAPCADPPLEAEETAFTLQQLRSCEICAKVDDATWEFLRRYQYDLVADGAQRAKFAARSGFCVFHTWEYRSIASPYGACVGVPPLLDRLAEQLRTVANPGRRLSTSKGIAAAQPASHDECVLCGVRDKAEAKAIAALAERMRNTPAETLSRLSAICLPHLSMLAAASQDDPVVLRALAAHHAALLERVSEDMRSFTLKHNAVRHYLETKEEQTAAERAFLLLAGYRNVNFETGAIASKAHRPKPAARPAIIDADHVEPEA